MSPRVFAECLVCANLREISRNFLPESSRLRIFVRGVNAKKELFFGGGGGTSVYDDCLAFSLFATFIMSVFFLFFFSSSWYH